VAEAGARGRALPPADDGRPVPDATGHGRLPAIIAVVGLAGAIACILGVLSASARADVEPTTLLFAGLAFAVGAAPVLYVRSGHQREHYTLAEAAVVVTLGTVPAGWLVPVAGLAVTLTELAWRRTWYKALYNGMTASLAVGAAGTVAVLLHGNAPFHDGPPLPAAAALVAAAATYWVVNEFLIACAVAAAQRLRARAVLSRLRVLRLVNFAGNTALGLVVLALARWSPPTLVLLPPTLGVLWLSYRRTRDTSQERDAWRQLNEAADDLSRLDEAEVVDAALRRALTLFSPQAVDLVLTGGHSVSHPEGGAGPDNGPEPPAAVVEAPLGGVAGPVGRLRLGFGGPVTLTEHESQVLAAFAHMVSSAVANARLYAHAQRSAAHSAHAAGHDSLTGLPNRRLLLDRCAEAIEESRQSGSVTGLLLVDLDRFKEVNDALGHPAGDRLLCAVADRLLLNLRRTDLVARLGGDEFAILVTGMSSPAGVETLASQVVALLGEPVAFDGLVLAVAGSVGVACYPPDGATVEELLQRADVAMYQAKIERGAARRYRAELDASSIDHLALVAELRQALTDGHVSVHYQPEIDLRTRQPVRLEALARWTHPVRDLLLPSQFVPAVEHSGLVREFTLHVLRRAIGDCAGWRREHPDLGVAVNLSARNLTDRSLPASVRQLLEEFGLPPRVLTLEITETAVMSDPVVAAEVLARLRDVGVRLSIDDFGTGYSSLVLLQRVVVDELKVDREFVRTLSAHGSAIVRATVDMAHGLGLGVVAEGVENVEQLQTLAGMRCDLAQGYHIAPPMPAELTGSWLRSRRPADVEPEAVGEVVPIHRRRPPRMS
jgi:diguanylate cyclase (GGDEF)-like protein